MKIATKLYALVGGLLALAATIGGVGLYGMGASVGGLETVYLDRVVPLRDLKDIADAYAVDIVDTTHKVRNGEMTPNEGLANVERAEKKIGERWQAYLATFLVAEEKILVSEIEPRMKAADAATAKLKSLLREARINDVAVFSAKELYQAIDPVSESFSRLVVVQLDVAKEVYEKDKSAYATTRNLAVLLMCAGIAGGFGVAILIVRRAVLRPLAELKVAQEKLVQAEKMASLGQLVAGVAHEINSPVGVALTAASYLEQESRKLDGLMSGNSIRKSDLAHYTALARQSARSVQVNLHRASHLIQSFKQVAVDQTSQERRCINLAGYINETLLSLQPQLKRAPHRIIVDCPADLELDSYPGALAHVLTNLIANALTHAFDNSTPGTIRISAQRDADRVVMVFADDGKGIAPEHLGKIFEPFFTTCRGRGGSGLGLSVVYNSVTACLQGSVSCESTLGRGTSFTLRFPGSLANA